MSRVDVTDRVQAAEVDDDALSHRTAGHPASRPSGDQCYSPRAGPLDELRYVVRVGRNGDGGRKRARDPRPFSVDGSREKVVAVEAAEGGEWQ
jgi:hypothetical protein